MESLLSRYKEIIIIAVVMIFGSYLISYVSYESLLNRTPPSLLTMWNSWDSPHYLDIAENGYRHFGDEMWIRIVFFPFYPFLIWIFAFVLKSYKLSALVISNLAYGVACYYLYKLVLKRDDHDTAIRSVFYMSIFPTAYFLHAGYTESVFLALTIASFYYADEKRWLIASIFGMLASATRITGILLFPSLLIEYLSQNGYRIKGIRLSFLYLFLIFVGFIVYVVINYLTLGNPFAFLDAQRENWQKVLSTPLKGLMGTWSFIWSKNANPSYRILVGWAELLFAIFGLLCTIWAFVRLRVSYGVYMLLTWISVTSTSYWLSVPRYTLSLFPIFILLALVSRRSEVSYLITVLFLLSYVFFLVIFAQGHWAF